MSIFKKLTTLVQAQINDIISPLSDETDGPARRRWLARSGMGQDMANDVTLLRKRVDEALAYEDKLQKQLDALYQDVSDLDTKADEALQNGQESQARGYLGQMHAKQREIAAREADMSDHRAITQELLSQVNSLEAVLEQTRREQQEQAAQSAETAERTAQTQQTRIRVEMDAQDEKAGQVMETLARKVDETRRKLGELITTQADTPLARPEEVVDEVPPPPVHPMDRQKVDDDLARRIERLSKPDDPQKK